MIKITCVMRDVETGMLYDKEYFVQSMMLSSFLVRLKNGFDGKKLVGKPTIHLEDGV